MEPTAACARSSRRVAVPITRSRYASPRASPRATSTRAVSTERGVGGSTSSAPSASRPRPGDAAISADGTAIRTIASRSSSAASSASTTSSPRPPRAMAEAARTIGSASSRSAVTSAPVTAASSRHRASARAAEARSGPLPRRSQRISRRAPAAPRRVTIPAARRSRLRLRSAAVSRAGAEPERPLSS
jgi:hypothetical protein